MSIDDAIRYTEILLGFAFIQASIEHLVRPKDEQLLFTLRIVLSVLLVIGFQNPWVMAAVLVALVVLSLFILMRFNGPYNGGSDRMGLLILCCLTATYFMPNPLWRDYVFGYLAIQLVLSYFISGWVKIVSHQWRTGRALQDVFAFSAYPTSQDLRRFSKEPILMLLMSWCVMVFELLFPLSLLNATSLIAALVIAAIFHLANAFLFGLNRFFWTWLCAYPSIIWLQDRIF